jgi:hypothetical protein
MHVFSLEDFSFVVAFTDLRVFLLNFSIKMLYNWAPDLQYMFMVMSVIALVSLVLACKL